MPNDNTDSTLNADFDSAPWIVLGRGMGLNDDIDAGTDDYDDSGIDFGDGDDGLDTLDPDGWGLWGTIIHWSSSTGFDVFGDNA